VRLLGDYHHNLKVLQLRKNLLILVRRPTDLHDYLPCTLCLGFIHAKDMWRHIKRCPCHVEPIQPHSFRRYQAESRLLLQPVLNDCSAAGPALQQVLNIMHTDDIRLVAKGDPLILSYGNVLAEKMARHETTYVSRKNATASQAGHQTEDTQQSAKHISCLIFWLLINLTMLSLQ